MPSDDQMNEIMKEFTQFLKEGDQSDGFGGAIGSVIKEMISKESMYEPMKKLKDAYPEWLDQHWQSLPDEDLERYNRQLDKVTEICIAFESENENTSSDGKQKIFELLNDLQELGHPPQDLMSKIHDFNQFPADFNVGNSTPVQQQQAAAQPKPKEKEKEEHKLNNPFEKLE